jgi:hypothetical protein
MEDSELFERAAEHFADREFDRPKLVRIWDELEREAMTAAEVADTTDLSVRDAAGLLDWIAEQGMLETGRSGDDKRVYARYPYQLEEYHRRAGELRESMRDLWKYSAGGSLLLVFALLYIRGMESGVDADPSGIFIGVLEVIVLGAGCLAAIFGLLSVVALFAHIFFRGADGVLGWFRGDSDDA